MNYKVLALGVAVGFLVALSPSCGDAEDCADTCNGCCDAEGVCIEATDTTAAACGTGGQTCTACAANQTCSNGTCVGGPVDGGGGGTDAGGCGPGNCNGCCASTSGGNTICLTGGSNTNCGTGGVACATCSGGQTCQAGTCETPDSGIAGIGTPCVGNPDAGFNAQGMTFPAEGECTDVPASQVRFCKQTTSFGNLTYQDGHCTRWCYQDSHCGPGNSCVYWLGSLGESTNMCFNDCAADADCRDGYVCVGVDSDGAGNITKRVCLPEPPPLADGGMALSYPDIDAGTPGNPGVSGSACTEDTACQPPETGFCEPESTRADGGVLFQDGFCSSNCEFSLQDEFCGDGGMVQLYLNPNGPAGTETNPEFTGIICLCEQRCSAPGTQAECRTGYTCQAAQSGDRHRCVPL